MATRKGVKKESVGSIVKEALRTSKKRKRKPKHVPNNFSHLISEPPEVTKADVMGVMSAATTRPTLFNDHEVPDPELVERIWRELEPFSARRERTATGCASCSASPQTCSMPRCRVPSSGNRSMVPVYPSATFPCTLSARSSPNGGAIHVPSHQ